VKWGYRCERLDLIASSDIPDGGAAHKKLFRVVDALLRPFRRLAHRTSRA
jgi:hypothetical protein